MVKGERAAGGLGRAAVAGGQLGFGSGFIKQQQVDPVEPKDFVQVLGGQQHDFARVERLSHEMCAGVEAVDEVDLLSAQFSQLLTMVLLLPREFLPECLLPMPEELSSLPAENSQGAAESRQGRADGRCGCCQGRPDQTGQGSDEQGGDGRRRKEWCRLLGSPLFLDLLEGACSYVFVNH